MTLVIHIQQFWGIEVILKLEVMERVSVKLEGSRKIKITFKKIRDLYENVYELEKRERKQLELWNEK